MWSRDGQELLYGDGQGRMMSVSVDLQPTFKSGDPSVVFKGPYKFDRPFIRNYDLHPDGQRFLMIKEGEGSERIDLVLVQNWFEELERLVPTD